MDPLEVFPPEICWRIFELLGPEDLCRCLAVSQQWRNLANADKYWQCFCKKRGLNLTASEQTEADTPLCQWATVFINYMNTLVNNWKESRFDSFLLPKEDWCCCIASYKRHVAVYYPRTSNVHLYHISKSVDFIRAIHIELPYGIAIPDVFINEYFLVVSKGNVVIIYKNIEEYPLYKIIVGHEFGLTIGSNIFPVTENGKRLYVKVISENTIWMESDTLYVVDVYSDSYKVLNDTFRCLRVDRKHIYAANDEVSCYNFQGDKQFSLDIRCVEDMWVKDETIVVLIGEIDQHLEVWNLKSKSMMCQIFVQKDPSVTISQEMDSIYVLEIIDNLYTVTCFSIQTGSLLWTYEQFFHREITVHPHIHIICDRFIFARPSYTFDTNYILLDSKSGKVLYDAMMPPCLLPPCYIYHLSDELFITAESNLIHIRSYL